MHSAFTAIYFIAKAKRNWKAWISRPNHQVLDLKSVLNLEHSTHTGIHTKFGTCSLYTLVPRYGRTVVIRHNELYDFLFWGCWAIRSRSRIRNWPWCRIISANRPALPSLHQGWPFCANPIRIYAYILRIPRAHLFMFRTHSSRLPAAWYENYLRVSTSFGFPSYRRPHYTSSSTVPLVQTLYL